MQGCEWWFMIIKIGNDQLMPEQVMKALGCKSLQDQGNNVIEFFTIVRR